MYAYVSRGALAARREPGSRRSLSTLTRPELDSTRDRLRTAVIVASTGEPRRLALSRSAVVARARMLIATMANAVPAAAEAETAHPAACHREPSAASAGSIAERLRNRLTAIRPTPALVATLNAALVMLADHELSSSTVAARVAASVRADPCSVVLAGLGRRPERRLRAGRPLHRGTDAGDRGRDHLHDRARRRLDRARHRGIRRTPAAIPCPCDPPRSTRAVAAPCLSRVVGEVDGNQS